MNRKIQLLICVVFLSLGLNAQGRDDKRKDNEQTIQPVISEGVVYALPRTGFVIEVVAERSTFTPGPYHQYAQKYLGIEQVRSRPETSWNIVGIKVKPFSEADPDAMFKAMDPVAGLIVNDGCGIITGVNTGAVSGKCKMIGDGFIPVEEAPDQYFTDRSSNEFYELLVDTENGIETMKTKSLEEKAREAADYIIRLRKKRAYAILDPSDVIPEDGKGYAVFVKEAQRLDALYTSLFAGVTNTSKHQFSFHYLPGNKDVKNEVLFRFSDEKGVLPRSDLSGRPVSITLNRDAKAYEEASKLSVSDHPEAGATGLFYRVPVMAELKVNDGLSELYSGRSLVSQLGTLAPVPLNLTDGQYQISYNRHTGAIERISKVN